MPAKPSAPAGSRFVVVGLPALLPSPARPSQRRKTRTPCMDDAEAAPSPRAPMAALESTLNAEAEDSIVVKETALTTTEDEEDNGAVGPLEAWGETKEPEKEEKKLHQCVFDTNRKLQQRPRSKTSST